MQRATLWWFIESLAWLARGLSEWWCWLLGMSGIWQHQPGLASTSRSYSLGRTTDSLQAACGLTAPMSVIVWKYCRAWDPTDLRTLGISRVGLFAPGIVALVIIMTEWGGLMELAWCFLGSSSVLCRAGWGCCDVCLEENNPVNMLNVWMGLWDCLFHLRARPVKGLWRASNMSQNSLYLMWWVKPWLGCKGKYLKA